MRMTVGKLKELLDGIEDDVEVRLATQPNWPFMHGITDVIVTEVPEIVTRDQFEAMDEVEQEFTVGRADNDEVLLLDVGEKPPVPVCYIAESSQLGYLPGDARNALGWNDRH